MIFRLHNRRQTKTTEKFNLLNYIELHKTETISKVLQLSNFKHNKKNKQHKINKTNKSKHNINKNQGVKKELFYKKTIISVSQGSEKQNSI